MNSSRKNNSYLSFRLYRWVKQVDKQIVISLILLMIMSLILITTTSPSIASKLKLPQNYFIIRQIIYILAGMVIMFCLFLTPRKFIKLFGIFAFIFSIIMIIMVKLYGYEIKGAKRWIRILGISYQPSELLKTSFTILSAWLLSVKAQNNRIFPNILIFSLYFIIAILLLNQPDIGMLIMITLIIGSQLFIFGLSLLFVWVGVLLSILIMIFSYYHFEHVAYRVNNFLFSSEKTYQVSKSILSLQSGGLYGVGPGEGVIKYSLPDAHTDFIYAALIEEFGLAFGIILILIYLFITIKILTNLLKERDLFIQICTFGLTMQFIIQAFINISVTLSLVPTKGMTLPFISYGGSSMINMSIVFGLILNLSKKKYSLYKYREIIR